MSSVSFSAVKPLLLFLLSAIPLLADAQTFPELMTLKGRIYKNVIIKKIEPDGIRVSHADGVAKIGFDDLTPDQRNQFGLTREARDKYVKETQPDVAAQPENKPQPSEPTNTQQANSPSVKENAWQPKSDSDVSDCCLLVNITKKLNEHQQVVAGAGSAFLCNVGGNTYIYSNVHNFDGTFEFEIKDKQGTKYTDFASVEMAAEGQAYWEEQKRGGDIVRIRLKSFREKALTLSSEPLRDPQHIGKKILITGNTRGEGVVTELKGEITQLAKEQIIIHNAPTEAGNSGSPIVDQDDYKVIGILTWGSYDSRNPLHQIWSKQDDEERQGINAGAGLAQIRFEPTSFERLYQQRVAINQMKKNIRLLGLLDTLYPAKHGLFANRRAIVMGDYTIDDLLMESPNHPVVQELTTLSDYLGSKASSNVGVSNRDAMKRYVSTYQRCLSLIRAQRVKIEQEGQSRQYFFRFKIDADNIHKISVAYENLIARSIDWYAAQSGTKGETLPVDKRVRFPAFRSGLEGLGITPEKK